jgi:hypothetical protein
MGHAGRVEDRCRHVHDMRHGIRNPARVGHAVTGHAVTGHDQRGPGPASGQMALGHPQRAGADLGPGRAVRGAGAGPSPALDPAVVPGCADRPQAAFGPGVGRESDKRAVVLARRRQITRKPADLRVHVGHHAGMKLHLAIRSARVTSWPWSYRPRCWSRQLHGDWNRSCGAWQARLARNGLSPAPSSLSRCGGADPVAARSRRTLSTASRSFGRRSQTTCLPHRTGRLNSTSPTA